MTELEMYKHIVKLATAFESQYKEIATLTSEGDTLTMTIVNHRAPTLSRKFSCPDVKNKACRLMFASELMELRFVFERERKENIRYGFSVALQHMKESVLDALQQMDADEIKQLVNEEIKKRRPNDIA